MRLTVFVALFSLQVGRSFCYPCSYRYISYFSNRLPLLRVRSTSHLHSSESEGESSASTDNPLKIKIGSSDYLRGLSSRSLDEIMDELDEIPQEEIPEDVMKVLEKKIAENAPSRFEIMKDTLGINKFTVLLAIASAFMVLLNVIFGYGWAGVLLGYNPTTVEFENSLNNPQNQEKVDQMRLNNKVNLEDAIRRFKILEEDEHAFDNEGNPSLLRGFELRNLKEEDLILPDFIQPENPEKPE